MATLTHTLTDPTGKQTKITAEQAASYNQGANKLAHGFSVAPIQTATPTTPLQTPTPATQLKPASPVQLPTPQAQDANLQFQQTVQGSVDSARKTLDTKLAEDKKRVDDELAKLREQQRKTLEEAKPLTEPFRNDLETKERERLFVEENFNANQRLTNELDTLLSEGNALIARARGLPMNQRAVAMKTQRTMQDVSARVGVIEAVMSARNNQIAQAYTMIDRSIANIVADRTDSLNYYNTLLELDNAQIISLDKESKSIATEQLNLVKGDLDRAEKTADYIKGLMVDPQTAQFMADAGVTLTDTVEEIQAKMAEQGRRQEYTEAKNKLVAEGYQYLPVPTEGPDVVSFEVGGKTMYFRVPEDVLLDREYKQAQITSALQRGVSGSGGGAGSVDGSGLSGLARGVMNGTVDISKLTPTQYGQVMDEIVNAGGTISGNDKMVAYQVDRADRVMSMVDKALSNVSGWTTGFGSLLSNIPGTKAKTLEKELLAIKANIGFGELQAMRAASPTGGALGQVAVQELDALQSSLGSLDASQSPAELRKNLQDIKEHYNKWKATVAMNTATPQKAQGTVTDVMGSGLLNKQSGTSVTNNDPLGIL